MVLLYRCPSEPEHGPHLSHEETTVARWGVAL